MKESIRDTSTDPAPEIWYVFNTWATAVCLLLFACNAAAQSEHTVYGGFRFALQITDVPGDGDGLRNYQSRVGARSYIDPPWLRKHFPWLPERSGALGHAEVGSDRDRPQIETRLLYGGFKGPWGQVSYGKQWTAFYNAVGKYMDVGIDRSGFGYLGSDREGDTLHYSNLFGETYVQLDAIRDGDVGGGFNRVQFGLDWQGAVFRAGFAFDWDEGGGDALGAEDLSVDGSEMADGEDGVDDPCNEAGVDCIGLSAGWSLREFSIDVGLNRAMASRDHVDAGAVTFQFKPTSFAYYLELSVMDGPGTSSMSLAGGLQYSYGPRLSSFMEFSVIGRGGERSDTDYTLGVGIRLDFDTYF